MIIKKNVHLKGLLNQSGYYHKCGLRFAEFKLFNNLVVCNSRSYFTVTVVQSTAHTYYCGNLCLTAELNNNQFCSVCFLYLNFMRWTQWTSWWHYQGSPLLLVFCHLLPILLCLHHLPIFFNYIHLYFPDLPN